MRVIYLVRYFVAVALFFSFTNCAFAGCQCCDKCIHKSQNQNTNALLAVPEKKSHVGVLPYVKKDNKIYVLLGRERIDGKSAKSIGKFSEFGGRVELNGTTLVQNMLRELQEETLGFIKLSEDDLLKQGQLLYTNPDKGAATYYVFYPISAEYFAKSAEFNDIRAAWAEHKINPDYLEKDQFYWLALDDLMQQYEQIEDIDGNLHKIKFREYFVRDCLENKELAALTAQLR